MKTIPHHAVTRQPRLPLRRTLSMALGLAVAGLSCAVNAATTFPDWPLQTSADAVPPNIMFILDNSGSMREGFMASGVSRIGVQGSDHETWGRGGSGFINNASYFNAIGYNPYKKYEPWTREDGSKMTGGTSVNAVFTDRVLASGTTMDLRGHGESAFYVRKNPAATLTEAQLRYRGHYWRFRLRSDGRWWRSEYHDGGNAANRYWHNEVRMDPPGVPDQYTNYATWYSYHSTRMKVAKAGASLAFSGLEGEGYRVGYDTINSTGSNSYSLPVVPIPVTSDSGLFRGANRTSWFNRLLTQDTAGGTPLRTALHRAGNYFETNGAAWTVNGTGEELSCRRSYAILTTDGYWNDIAGGWATPFPVNLGNADGTSTAPNYVAERPYSDAFNNTLADVAMHFWKRDLRPTVGNNITPTPANPANWQHMVTFGVSIGLQGTIEPTDANLAAMRAGSLNWPNPLLTEDARRIDDLWHAAVNSRGQFVAASDAEQFAKALKDALDAIAAENAAGGGLGDTGRVVESGSHIYMGSYVSGSWLGDVLAYDFSSGQASGTPLWSFAAQSVAVPGTFKNRPIFTSTAGGSGVALSLGVLSPAAQAALGARSTGAAAVSAADNLAYIRGEQALEKQNGGTLRDRTTLVGDIVNSVPVAHGGALFVGANDGMLHAINAADGTVLFSYMPRGLDFTALAELSNPEYRHKFLVDGELHVSTTADGHGKNILVGVLGRGGRGLFALDVTNPSSFAAGNVLWDNTGGVHSDDGYILDKPLVLRSNASNKTVVVTANGVESAAGQARVQLYVLDGSGQVETRLSLGQTSGSGNGMVSIAAVDVDENGTVDYVYGGDMQGNVWKVDVTAATPASWQVQHGANTPMFTATDSSGTRQPITGGFSVSREPGSGRLFVSFGTGSYLSEADRSSTTAQTLYALVDDGSVISGRGQLQQRTLPHSATLADGRLARGAEPYSALPVGMRGWYLDLGTPVAQMAGERIVSAPEVSGRTLGVTTLVPGSGTGCTANTNGTFLLLDAFTGTNPQSSGASSGFLDLDGDGQADRVPGAPSGEGHVSSISTGTGMGGAQFYLRPDGSLALAAGGFNASIQQVGLLPGSSGGGRLNWRELISEN